MDERFPYSGPTVESRNLCRDEASKRNCYIAIEASFTAGKGEFQRENPIEEKPMKNDKFLT